MDRITIREQNVHNTLRRMTNGNHGESAQRAARTHYNWVLQNSMDLPATNDYQYSNLYYCMILSADKKEYGLMRGYIRPNMSYGQMLARVIGQAMVKDKLRVVPFKAKPAPEPVAEVKELSAVDAAIEFATKYPGSVITLASGITITLPRVKIN